MDLNNDDDYWTGTRKIHYNFDDLVEEEQFQEDSSYKDPSGIFSPSIEENTAISLNLLLSKSALEFILEDNYSPSNFNVPPVEETIKKMYHGQKYSIHVYKSLEDKLLLLDSALNTYDGVIILTVFNYLKCTLKPSLFYYHVSNKKIAINQYSNYLIINKKLQDLEDFYMATGNIASMCEIYHISICKESTMSKQAILKLLETKANLITNPHRKTEITQYNHFIKHLLDNKENSPSIIAHLAALIKEVLSLNKNLETSKVIPFKKTFNIDDFQFEWTLLNVMCSLALWSKLIDYFIKPNWFTKKNTLKSVIRGNLFIMTVHKHGGPRACLEDLLPYLNDSKEALELAERFKCHKYVVQYFVANKDKNGLESYKVKVQERSEDYIAIENALLSLDSNVYKRRSLGNLLK